jgi:eukaryotic-like serine/threonine-protein kinase
MPLANGTRLGPYEVTAQIGAGGMGEVYRAMDAALGRAVAIKVLPDVLAGDPERLARFEREARTLASLSHPNIATIHGFHDFDGVRALVMELVEGPTLADRIAQGPLPIEEALPIAKQIAEAFETAHEQGIIHRDLKPANVKVRLDGTVKVLDFGLAKALESGPAAAADSTWSPTITSPATQLGVILGTAAYMAPEQARGRAADRRSDIWAFGCVLYEMLAGRRAFGPGASADATSPSSRTPGDDVADTLAAVLRAEPDWSALPGETPAHVKKLLIRCLQKDVRRRLPHIGAARLEIEDAIANHDAPRSEGAAAQVHSPRARLAWTAALSLGLVAALLAVPAITHWREAAAVDAPEMRVEITTPPSPDLSFALSPDGRHLAFVAAGNGPPQLWIRSLGDTTARPLPGTEEARYPFWSPDSRSIGFFSRSSVKRIDVAGGSSRALASASPSLGATWNGDGTIVFAGAVGGPLGRVPASGGAVTVVTTLGNGTEGGHLFPWFLPDQRRFVFFARGSRPGLYLASLDSPAAKWVGDADSGAIYAPPGWLLFARDGALVAQRFDSNAGELAGEPLILADRVSSIAANGAPPVSAAANGLIAYRNDQRIQRQLAWFDRSGKRLGNAAAPGDFANPALAPDGRVAVERVVDDNRDIWILDQLRMRRLTTDSGRDRFPVWSHDGARVFFASDRQGLQKMFVQAADGVGAAATVIDPSQASVPNDVSRDGRFLLFLIVNDKTQTREDLGVLPLEGAGKPSVLVNSPFTEMWAQFSPDGSWAAYQSNQSGTTEIYVRPVAGLGGEWPVSTAGGIHARWARDGRELYYVARDGQLMAVAIALKGATPGIGAPIPLFRPAIVGGGSQVLGLSAQYDVAADGRFLVNVTEEESATPPITLLLNWNPEPAR